MEISDNVNTYILKKLSPVICDCHLVQGIARKETLMFCTLEGELSYTVEGKQSWSMGEPGEGLLNNLIYQFQRLENV